MAKTPPFSLCNEFCVGGGGASNAKDVKYDNKTSGLKADNVGGAIDEICTKMNDIDTAKDWNQNDPKKADYIKNRPFYDDGTKVKQLEEKFIPDTIARTEDVDKKMEDAEANVAAKIAESLVPFEVLKIKPTASGELISLSDSAEAPLQNMKIFGKTEQFTTTGKSKLPYPYYHRSFTKYGITFTDNGDGSITLNGTATADANFFFATKGNFLEAGKTYCIVTKMPNVNTVMAYKDENGQTKYIGDNMATSVVWSENYTLGNIYMFVPNGVTANNTVYPIIVEGSSYDGVWEPYTGGIPSPNPNYPQELVSVGDGGSITEYVMGKNLISYPYIDKSATKGGLTWTVNPDGSVMIQGKNTSNYNELILNNITNAPLLIENVKYKIAGGTSYAKLLISYLNEKGKNEYVNSGQVFVWKKEYTFLNLYVSVTDKTSINETIYPVLFLEGFDNTYEPYKEQSLTIPTPNGLPGLDISLFKDKFDYAPSYIVENKAFICNEIDCKRLVHRKPILTIVYTGDENWSKSSSSEFNRFSISLPKVSGYGKTSHFKSFASSTELNNGEDGAYTIYSAALHINASQFATLEEFKAFLKSQYEAGTPLTFVYAVQAEADIIETPLTEEEIAAYKALHTNYPNTTIYNSDGAGAEVEYVADTKNYIDNKFAELQANILSIAK